MKRQIAIRAVEVAVQAALGELCRQVGALDARVLAEAQSEGLLAGRALIGTFVSSETITEGQIRALMDETFRGRSNASKRALRVDCQAALDGSKACRERCADEWNAREDRNVTRWYVYEIAKGRLLANVGDLEQARVYVRGAADHHTDGLLIVHGTAPPPSQVDDFTELVELGFVRDDLETENTEMP